jgi:hypothetical protein
VSAGPCPCPVGGNIASDSCNTPHRMVSTQMAQIVCCAVHIALFRGTETIRCDWHFRLVPLSRCWDSTLKYVRVSFHKLSGVSLTDALTEHCENCVVWFMCLWKIWILSVHNRCLIFILQNLYCPSPDEFKSVLFLQETCTVCNWPGWHRTPRFIKTWKWICLKLFWWKYLWIYFISY